MIRNGLYSLIAVAIDGLDIEVGGVLILRDGQIHGSNSYRFLHGDLRQFRGQVERRNDQPENILQLRGRWQKGSSTSGSAGPTTTPV